MTSEQYIPDFAQASEVTMQTYQQIAPNYAARHKNSLPQLWQDSLGLFIDKIRSSPASAKSPTLPVLDAGCGHGRDSLLLAQAGFTVQAIDLSESMLVQARNLIHNQSGAERVTFKQMDMRHLELDDASCAGIWVSASFLHIPKKENRVVLNELVRVLAPDSPLMLLVKEIDGGADERYDPFPESDSLRFFARYSGGELWNLLEQAGLRVLRITSDGGARVPGEQSWLAALTVKTE